MSTGHLNAEIAAAIASILSRITGDDREHMVSAVGGISCVRELVDVLRNEFLAKAAGFLWWTGASAVQPCLVVPGRQRRFLCRCLAKREIKDCLEALSSQEPGRYEWVSPVRKGAEFEEFVAVGLPLLHGGGSERGIGMMCLVDRLIRPSLRKVSSGTDIGSIHDIVDFWASRMVHRRALLHSVCDRCRWSPAEAHQDRCLESLRALTKTLRRMLSLRDMVTVAEALDTLRRSSDAAATRQDGAGHTPDRNGTTGLGPPFDETPDLLSDILDDWRHCAPPRWPPTCKRPCSSDAGLRNLAEWARWRNCTAADIAGDKPGDRAKAKEKVRDRLGLLWGPIRRSVDPGTNFLPHGLRCYVLTQHADSWLKERMAFWGSEAASCEELADAISSMAMVTHYVVGAMPLDEKTIDAMVWLLSEYAHHGLGVPTQIDLRTHLLQAARSEPALHVLRHFYRDHFFHALEVCFLGHFLLSLKVTSKKRLWQLVADRLRRVGRPCGQQEVLRLWYLTALLHDVGYGIDVLKGVRSLLGFFNKAQPLGDLAKRLADALDRLSEDLGAQGLALYATEDKPGEDHGVVAAWHLQKLLERAAEKDGKLQWQDYLPAIRAIALHNSRKYTVRFADDPLAFLLVLCDTLQEWNRPYLGFPTAPSYLLSRLLEQRAGGDQLEGPLDGVQANVSRMARNAGFKLKSYAEPLRFTLEFNERIRWNAGVFNLWVDASCNLQRLDFTGLPKAFDVEIEYHTPLFRREPGAAIEQQFHRLRDAAGETHITSLDRWFPQRQGRKKKEMTMTNGAVTWRPGETTADGLGLEMLRLRLRELSKIKPVTGGIEEFRQQLARWRRYNDDREFAGDYGAPEIVP